MENQETTFVPFSRFQPLKGVELGGGGNPLKKENLGQFFFQITLGILKSFKNDIC